MSRIKMALMAMVAVFAIGAVGANAAQAGTGHIDTSVGSCDFEFTADSVISPDPIHTGWAHSQELYDFAPDPSGTCDVSTIEGELHLHWQNNGDAQAIGEFSVPGLFSGMCTYAGTLNGTWNGTRFELDDPSSQSIGKTSGSFFNCPLSSINVLSDTAASPPDYTWLQP